MEAHEPDAVVVRGVSHRYGLRVALDDVSLRLPIGETMAVVGPDGVGKSTLLGLIAGVRRLQAGSVEVLGGDMGRAAHRGAVAQRIAYMPQGLGRSLYPTLTVRENIEFAARLFGLSRGAREARMKRLLAATGLDPFPDRPAGKLSGGMKQKLALCCALIHTPDLLVLDEPTTGIDVLSRRQFWALVAALRSENARMTMLVATAYMEEAESFRRVAMMDDGRVLAAGPKDEVLAESGARSIEAAFQTLRGGGDGGRSIAFTIPPRPQHDGPAALRAEGLTRRFGRFTAVDNVSFSIERGEIFGFIGSNGCGKTTTMKMLTGLLPASAGRAWLLGRSRRATWQRGCVSATCRRASLSTTSLRSARTSTCMPVFIACRPSRSSTGLLPSWTGSTSQRWPMRCPLDCRSASSSACNSLWPACTGPKS